MLLLTKIVLCTRGIFTDYNYIIGLRGDLDVMSDLWAVEQAFLLCVPDATYAGILLLELTQEHPEGAIENPLSGNQGYPTWGEVAFNVGGGLISQKALGTANGGHPEFDHLIDSREEVWEKMDAGGDKKELGIYDTTAAPAIDELIASGRAYSQCMSPPE